MLPYLHWYIFYMLVINISHAYHIEKYYDKSMIENISMCRYYLMVTFLQGVKFVFDVTVFSNKRQKNSTRQDCDTWGKVQVSGEEWTEILFPLTKLWALCLQASEQYDVIPQLQVCGINLGSQNEIVFITIRIHIGIEICISMIYREI